MRIRLTHLHAQMLATRDSGWSAEIRAGAEAAYRAYALEIAAGLPFPHSLVRVVSSSSSPSGVMPPVVHIVPTENLVIGQLRRVRGDALCKPRWHFAGKLGDLCPVEEGASCYKCLKIAERLSIVEFQAS
jgi:hypothetical protein